MTPAEILRAARALIGDPDFEFVMLTLRVRSDAAACKVIKLLREANPLMQDVGITPISNKMARAAFDRAIAMAEKEEG